MEYAKFQDSPLPTGSSYLRVNHAEANFPFGETPIMVLSVEKRTVLSDGTSFGTQLDSVSIPLEGKDAGFDLLDRLTGEQRKTTVLISDLSDMIFSAGRFALEARDAVLTAQKRAEEAQALADKLRDDPLSDGLGHDERP